jgi:putative Ca2+/H+ antiporter (TMEM165/GDT1 family)
MSSHSGPDEHQEALETVEQRAHGDEAWSVGRILIETFSLTFVAEWGDRTQLATITLAAAHHPVGVVAGTTLGHGICAAIAVVCGKFLAGRISERLLTGIGGMLFIIFGLVAAFDRIG